MNKASAFRLPASLLIAAMAAGGIVIQMTLPIAGRSAFGMWRYFTVQSNALVALAAALDALALVRGRRPGTRLALFRGLALFAITVTSTMFALFLSRLWNPPGMAGLANSLLHAWTPLAFWAYWLVFGERGLLKPTAPALWLGYPLAYLAGSLLVGSVSGFYPYWFINPAPPPDGLGSYGHVALFSLGSAAAFLVLGYALWGVDRFLAAAAVRLVARKQENDPQDTSSP